MLKYTETDPDYSSVLIVMVIWNKGLFLLQEAEPQLLLRTTNVFAYFTIFSV